MLKKREESIDKRTNETKPRMRNCEEQVLPYLEEQKKERNSSVLSSTGGGNVASAVNWLAPFLEPTQVGSRRW